MKKFRYSNISDVIGEGKVEVKIKGKFYRIIVRVCN
jgi:hypothetical protein